MKIYLLVSSISAVRGGLTSALYKRANQLSKHFKDVIILTFNTQSNIEGTEEELKKINKIDENVTIKSFFHDQVNTKKFKINLKDNYIQQGDDFTRIFNINGIFSQYQKYTNADKNKLQFIDYMNEVNPKIKSYREIYRNNIKSCIIYYDEKNNETQKIILKNDKPFINIMIKEDQIKTFIFDKETVRNTNIDKEYNQWLKGFINSDDIVFFEDNFKNFLSFFKDIDCRKIAFFHSHEKFDKQSKFLESCRDFDTYVFLTQKQLDKISKTNTKISKNYFYLPHYYNETKNINQNLRRNRIITISRLTKNKCIIDGIRAFSIISKKYPNIIYEIYGKGPEADNIKEEIKHLGLEDKVFLMDYTQDPLKLFSESILSISLSDFEGFGLSILESLSMSCPVISYDVEYGPQELIQNNINGFLCPQNDLQSIANAIEKILINSEYFQNNCINSIQKYSLNNWENRLLNLFK
ncbi:glycosyltransferase [Acinetobacter towneri]|uniref:glycosyltransferase n=1 Tax=Acinetobacter towneri TaxID=202956 RepID=UPI003A8939B0